VACSNSSTSPTPTPIPAPTTTPTATPPPPLPRNFMLTGRVTDAETSAPIANATVCVSQCFVRATTDDTGNYSVPAALVYGHDYDWVATTADGFFADVRYVRALTQDVRLRRVNRIAAGDSTIVTVSPDDSVCANNLQELGWGITDYVCGRVIVIPSASGIVTIEALSTKDGSRPPLEVEPWCQSSLNCSFQLENPAMIRAPAGMEIVVSIEMSARSTTSESFIVNTSYSP